MMDKNRETQLTHALRTLERGRYHQALRQLEKLVPLLTDDPTLSEQVRLAMADAHLR